MTDDFKELREALEAGPTDGPWKADRWTSDEGGCYGWSFSAGGYLLPLSDMETDNPDECDANARYIAAANPAVIRSLLAELDAARLTSERPYIRAELPPLPEWALRDDLGGLVPSEIRAAMRVYARAAVTSHEAAIDAAMKEQQP